MATPENTEWDGGEDEIVQPPPVTTAAEEQTGGDKAEKKPEGAATPPPVAPPVQGSPWRMTPTPPAPASVKKPAVAGGGPEQSETLPVKLEAKDLPKGDNESHQLLKEWQHKTHKTKAARAIVAANIALIRQHIFKIQQGLPKVIIDANAFHSGHANHAAILKTQRLEFIGRVEPLVKELIDENARLLDIVKKTQDAYDELSAANTRLRAEHDAALQLFFEKTGTKLNQ